MKKTIVTILLVFSANFLFANENKYSYSSKLKPKFSKEYYAEESNKYFDTLDTYADRDSKPKYSSHVIRWEWYPWLFLTGYKDHWMWLDRLVILYPTEVINRECKGFDVQPFGRCRVTFHYIKSDSYVDIYEEFTFNDQGEMTFIEAWSDMPKLMPMNPEEDFWAQGKDVKRLSTKVPGLGSYDGKINRTQLKELSETDPDLKNLRKRINFASYYWVKEAARLGIKGHGH